jgi:hypothetical protein
MPHLQHFGANGVNFCPAMCSGVSNFMLPPLPSVASFKQMVERAFFDNVFYHALARVIKRVVG